MQRTLTGLLLAVAGAFAPAAHAETAARLATARTAAPDQGRAFATIFERRVEARSADGRCDVSVLWPQVSGLKDKAVEERVNRFLESKWLGPGRQALQPAREGECPTAYLASVGFNAWLSPSGILSVKKTHAVMRGDGYGGSLTSTCWLLDLKRGGRLEPATLLGPRGLEKLSKLTQEAVKQRVQLARGNFTACTDGAFLLVQLEKDLVGGDERKAVEAKIPLAALEAPGLRLLRAP